MNPTEIPEHWSAEQALAVWEFLEEVAGLVWERYERPLIELIRPDLDHEDGPPLDFCDLDDDIPF
jgi:hypothetical protein